jgi:hypothetical protein
LNINWIDHENLMDNGQIKGSLPGRKDGSIEAGWMSIASTDGFILLPGAMTLISCQNTILLTPDAKFMCIDIQTNHIVHQTAYDSICHFYKF